MALVFWSFQSCNNGGGSANEGEAIKSQTIVSEPNNLSTGETTEPYEPSYRDRANSPYYGPYLEAKYSPDQIDFSKDFYAFMEPDSGKDELNTDILFRETNFSGVWTTGKARMGVIGKNYQRIDITFTSVVYDSLFRYRVTGSSKVNNTVCSFQGFIEILHAINNHCQDFGREEGNTVSDKPDWCGAIVYKYSFTELGCDATGTFEGTGVSDVYIENLKGYTDNSSDIADGYANNDFVGVWRNSKTGAEKKCIWGDYRLPYTFDFDQGDGEMYINTKYRKYGWYTDSTTNGWWKPSEY